MALLLLTSHLQWRCNEQHEAARPTDRISLRPDPDHAARGMTAVSTTSLLPRASGGALGRPGAGAMPGYAFSSRHLRLGARLHDGIQARVGAVRGTSAGG